MCLTSRDTVGNSHIGGPSRNGSSVAESSWVGGVNIAANLIPAINTRVDRWGSCGSGAIPVERQAVATTAGLRGVAGACIAAVACRRENGTSLELVSTVALLVVFGSGVDEAFG